MPFYSSQLQSWTPPTLHVLRGAPRWNVIKTDFTMSQLSQRVSYQSAPLYSYTLACAGLKQDEWQAILNLYAGCKGSLIPFKLIIGGQTKYCIIIGLDWEKVTPVSYNVNLTVEEVSPAEIIVDE